MIKKKALIFGCTGQDGSYLAEFLLRKGYTVHGVKRRASTINTYRLDHIYEDVNKKNKKFILHYGEMTDSLNVSKLIYSILPDEIYNLAAQSHVAVSFETPEYTANVDALGTLRILDAIKTLGKKKKLNFIKRVLQRCLEKFNKHHKMSKLLFIQEVHMLFQSCFLIGSQ